MRTTWRTELPCRLRRSLTASDSEAVRRGMAKR